MHVSLGAQSTSGCSAVSFLPISSYIFSIFSIIKYVNTAYCSVCHLVISSLKVMYSNVQGSLVQDFLFLVTQAQTSCGSLQHYVDTHQNFHISGHSCSGLSCHDNNTDISFTVQKCEDPVTVDVYIMESSKKRESLSYQFKQSETMITEFNTFTAIMDRNTSHLGFEVHT